VGTDLETVYRSEMFQNYLRSLEKKVRVRIR